MKAVMISIRPEWVYEILDGAKTIEIRKTAPKIATPFKCYIYCTLGKEPLSYADYCGYDMTDFREDFLANGKVVAEFTCDRIFPINVFNNGLIQNFNANRLVDSCVAYNDIVMYIGCNRSGFGWHISDLKIYDKPKPLSDFRIGCKGCKDKDTYHCIRNCFGRRELKRPPQSWCYVEEAE